MGLYGYLIKGLTKEYPAGKLAMVEISQDLSWEPIVKLLMSLKEGATEPSYLRGP